MTDIKKEYSKKDYYVEYKNRKYEIVEELITKDAPLHFHDYLEAELVVSGEGLQYINDFKTTIKKGSFTVLRPDFDCHSVKINNLRVIKFYVKPFIIEPELWKEITLLLDPLVIELNDEEYTHVYNIFKTIEYEQHRQNKYSDNIIKNGINSLLYLFVQKKEGMDNNVNARKSIIEYLVQDDKFLTDVTLQDFADDFGYSLSHASKYFKENTGMTFSEAKQYFRMQVAKRLLLSTDYSINEIAAKCGFNYYHLFHNTFKKSTGMTPFDFKKKNR